MSWNPRGAFNAPCHSTLERVKFNIMMMSQLSKKPPRATSKTRRGSCFGSRVPTVKRSLYPVIGSCNIPTRIRPSKKPPRLPEEAFPTDVSIFPLAQLTQWPRTFKIAPKLHLKETKWFHGLHEWDVSSKNLHLTRWTHGEAFYTALWQLQS